MSGHDRDEVERNPVRQVRQDGAGTADIERRLGEGAVELAASHAGDPVDRDAVEPLVSRMVAVPHGHYVHVVTAARQLATQPVGDAAPATADGGGYS